MQTDPNCANNGALAELLAELRERTRRIPKSTFPCPIPPLLLLNLIPV